MALTFATALGIFYILILLIFWNVRSSGMYLFKIAVLFVIAAIYMVEGRYLVAGIWALNIILNFVWLYGALEDETSQSARQIVMEYEPVPTGYRCAHCATKNPTTEGFCCACGAPLADAKPVYK